MPLRTELKKMPFLPSKSHEAMQLFHGTCGGQKYKLVKVVIKYNMPNSVLYTLTAASWGATSWPSQPFPGHTDFSWSLAAAYCQRQTTRAGNTVGSPATASLTLCTLVQLEVSYSKDINYPEPFQAILLQLTRRMSSLFNFYYYNLCQIFQSEYPSYWRWTQYRLGKQTKKPEHLKIRRINRFRNALAFTSASQETDFYG